MALVVTVEWRGLGGDDVDGSVALNGISLTVAEKNGCDIRVALIPETLAKTDASLWKPGALVNVEVDMIGKYVENFMKEAHLAK